MCSSCCDSFVDSASSIVEALPFHSPPLLLFVVVRSACSISPYKHIFGDVAVAYCLIDGGASLSVAS